MPQIYLIKNRKKNIKRSIQVLSFIKFILEDDGMQNYLVFQPAFKYLVAPTNMIIAQTSKGLSGESIKPPDTSGNVMVLNQD